MDKEERRRYMQEYRSTIRKECYELLGNKCALCDITEDLEFDHIDPTTKSFGIAANWTRKREELLAEVAKCQLLCKPHHIEKTRPELQEKFKGRTPWNKGQITHGNSGYSLGCRCDICREGKRRRRKPRVVGRVDECA